LDVSHKDSSSLRKPTCLQPRKYNSSPIKVKTIRLDTWYKESGLEVIDFIWSDVEGSERDMINGAKETLKNTRYLYCEYNEKEMYEGMALLPELIELVAPCFEVVNIFAYYNADGSFRHYGDVLFKNKDLDWGKE